MHYILHNDSDYSQKSWDVVRLRRWKLLIAWMLCFLAINKQFYCPMHSNSVEFLASFSRRTLNRDSGTCANTRLQLFRRNSAQFLPWEKMSNRIKDKQHNWWRQFITLTCQLMCTFDQIVNEIKWKIIYHCHILDVLIFFYMSFVRNGHLFSEILIILEVGLHLNAIYNN